MATATTRVRSLAIAENGPVLRLRDRPGYGGDGALVGVCAMGVFLTAFSILQLDGTIQVLMILFGLLVLALPVVGIVSRMRGLDTVVVDRSSGTVAQGRKAAAVSGVLALEVDHTIEFRRNSDGDEVGDGYPVWHLTITDGHQSYVIATSKSRHDVLKVTQVVGALIEKDASA